jgi:hypothetical protein
MVETDARLVAGVTRGLVRYDAAVRQADSWERALELRQLERFELAIVDSDLVTASDLGAFDGTPLVVTASLLEREQAETFARFARVLHKPFTSSELAAILSQEIELVAASNSLVDMLCRGHTARASWLLCVGNGELQLEGGELVHAALGALRGEAALAEILLWGGPIRRRQGESASRDITRPFRALLLDALAHVEARERRHGLDGRFTLRCVRGPRRRRPQ